jgi:hypothetical protein
MVVGAVLAALVVGGSCGPPKVPPGPNITTNYNGKWLTARATWYGQPNGAGAPDNGTSGIHVYTPPVGRSFMYCDAIKTVRRRCVRDQEREPATLQRHDGVRQRPHLQGRQGLWLMLRGAYISMP